MPEILISVDKLDAWSASCTEVLDIADALLRREWHVILCTSFIGKRLQPEMARLQATGALTIVTENAGELAARYDVIWVVKGFFCEKLLTALYEQKTAGSFIFRHYSDYNDLYIPWGAELENALATRVLGLSAFTQTILLQTGIEEDKLHLMPWLVPDAYCEDYADREAQELRRILYIADKMSAEMYEVQQRAAQSQLYIEWLDLSAQSGRIEPEWLAGYDVIITDEQYVPKALVLGVPVFLAHGNYVEGYLSDTNLAYYEANYFSGVNLRFCPGADEWIQLLTDGYEDAIKWVHKNHQTFVSRWSLEQNILTVLDFPVSQRPYTLSEKDRYALAFHSKALLLQQSENYSITRWIKDRNITSARRGALRACADAFPDRARLGVVILAQNKTTEEYQLTHASALAQSLVPISIEVAYSISDINALLENSPAQALLMLPAGYTLLDDALLRFAEHRIHYPEASVAYCDEMTVAENDEPIVTLRPGVNIDLLRSKPYIGQALLIDCHAAKAAGGLNPLFAYTPFIDLLWRLVELQGTSVLTHVPEVLLCNSEPAQRWTEQPGLMEQHRNGVLAHLTRLGISASYEPGAVKALPRLRYHWDAQPMVSIIIPTRDRFALLKNCIESLMEKTRYARYELMIVDNQSVEGDACQFLSDLASLGLEQVRILRYDEPFNFAEMGNAAAQQARGDVLVFLDNDCEIIDGAWLEALLEHALRPEVGVVGARLEFKDGRIQHGGYLTGVQNGVEVAFAGAGGADSGFHDYLYAPHNVTAVSGSCMMLRKDVFFALNGFTQERYPVYFADVDLGIRLQKQGYLNVWTPYSRVQHMGGATRLLADKYQVPERPMLEHYAQLRNEWKAELLIDPSYHPLMQKSGALFTLSENSARLHAPLPGRPVPVVLAHHVDWNGCGHHRVMQPFKALERHHMLEGGMVNSIPSVMEAAQLQPDVILLESLTGSRFPNIIQQLREVCNAKVIIEYDDFLLNVPLKNGNRENYPQHMVKSFRKILESADRIVVSTAPLAEAYSRFHHDIRIAQNRLAPDQWGHLLSQRGVGKKLRVGWAGGSTHAGDLQILLPLIKALENDVEWVFMGMKPRNVHCEFHPGVPFEMYPEKLANLNLDLALVPLEINQFNECKSNLRLLEIGTCGVPIVATDIAPYRCGLPVTLVENRFKDWMKAIQSYLNDADYRSRQGDELRNAVQRNWYLRENGLNDWQQGWLAQ